MEFRLVNNETLFNSNETEIEFSGYIQIRRMASQFAKPTRKNYLLSFSIQGFRAQKPRTKLRVSKPC